MFEAIKQAIINNDVELVRESIFSITLMERNRIDDQGNNLLFYAIAERVIKKREIIEILLQAGVSVYHNNHEREYVVTILTQRLEQQLYPTYGSGSSSVSNETELEAEATENNKILILLNSADKFTSTDKEKNRAVNETKEMLHQVLVARYADMLYARAIGGDKITFLKEFHPGHLGKIPNFYLFNKDELGLYSLHDIFSGRLAFIEGQDYNFDKLEDLFITNANRIIDQNVVADIIVGRHREYLKEHGADDNSYDLSVVTEKIPIFLSRALLESRFYLLKDGMFESVHHETADKILSLLKSENDDQDKDNNLKAFIIDNEKNPKGELNEAFDILLYQKVISPKYKAIICNALNECGKMSDEEREEVYYQYFPKPIDKIIDEVFEIIPLKGQVGEGNNSNTDILEILKLIGMSRENLREMEAAIAFVGPTGSGKTTTVCGLSGELLDATYIKGKGWQISDSRGNISDNRKSKTTIPIPYEVKIPTDTGEEKIITLIDCPGSKDTGGLKNEIVNSANIYDIFNNTGKLKFVLVVEEGIITTSYGSNFIEVINEFLGFFTTSKRASVFDEILGSISLVVTNTDKDKDEMGYYLTNIITPGDKGKTSLDSEVVKVISTLMERINIFPKPQRLSGSNKGEITIPDFDNICGLTEYIKVDKELASASISERSMGDAEALFYYVSSNFNQIVRLIFQILHDPYKQTQNDQGNLFIQTKLAIESMLPPRPDNIIQYVAEMPTHFAEIALLSELNSKLLDIDTIKNKQCPETIKFLSYVLGTLAKYSDEHIKKLIENTIYALNQYADFVSFFSKLCKLEELPISGNLFTKIVELRDIIDVLLEENIKNIELADNESDDYYEAAIEYLKHYPEDLGCLRKQAQAHIHLSKICQESELNLMSAYHLIAAMHLDPRIIIHEDIGDCFWRAASSEKQDYGSIDASYRNALINYQMVNAVEKSINCFDKLIEINNSLKLLFEKAKYARDVNHLMAFNFLAEAINAAQAEEEKKIAFEEGYKALLDYKEMREAIKVKNCFDKLLEICPDPVVIALERAVYLWDNYEKNIKWFQQALNYASTPDKKDMVWSKAYEVTGNEIFNVNSSTLISSIMKESTSSSGVLAGSMNYLAESMNHLADSIDSLKNSINLSRISIHVETSHVETECAGVSNTSTPSEDPFT